MLVPQPRLPVSDTGNLSSYSIASCLGSRHGLSSVGGGEGGGFAGPGVDPVGDLPPALSSMRSCPIPGTISTAAVGRGAGRHRATAAGPRIREDAVSPAAPRALSAGPTPYGSGVRESRSRCGCGSGGPRRRSRAGGRRRTASRSRRAAAGLGARPATGPGCGRRGCAG
jgi:hypothetical protein